MRRTWRILACIIGLSGLAGGVAMTRPGPIPTQSAAEPAPTEAAHIRKAGPWQAPAGLRQIPIWPHGAPDMAHTPQPGENLEIAPNPEAGPGGTATAIYDVSAPTMTVFPPHGRNTGAAMVVFPGGGFQILAIDLEGTEICRWLTARGITCILSKYRVPGSNHYWNAACKCHLTPRVLTSLQDAQRTIRLVRAGAGALHVDPHKIGVIGFSAGGYLVAQTSDILASAYRPVDAADRISSRPDFAIALYPGHLCRDGKLFTGIHVTKQTPPTFLLQAWDDPVDPVCNSTLYARALDEAGVPSEVHLFAKGGHAFALRRTHHAVAIWPSLVEKWLADAGVL